MKKINLWSVSRTESGQYRASGVEEVANTATEERLEDILVASPDLLMQGLQLIGRQLPTVSGPLDLLGIDEEGRLVLFELKRGTLTREAVAQALDYASELADRSFDSLSDLIQEHSGKNGIRSIEDFTDWYVREYPDADEPTDVPPRIVLVGLGVDGRALRIVNFLADRGVDIKLLTFHGFSLEGELFLARQVESRDPATTAARQGRETKRSNREQLIRLATDQGVEELLSEVAEFISDRLPAYRWPGKTAYSYSLQERTADGKVTSRSYLTLYVNQKKTGTLTLAMHERTLEAAPKAIHGFIEAVAGASYDEDRWPIIQADFDHRLWKEIVQTELGTTLEAISVGWKRKLSESDDEDEEQRQGG